MKKAIYTGSFDPITRGHIDMIKRAKEVFKTVIVGVGNNPAKKYLFTIEERANFIRNIFGDTVKVIIIPEGRFTADIAYEHNAVIIKGVRINADFDYERMMKEVNYAHNEHIDTLIFPAQPHLTHISSTAAKEVVKINGKSEKFVPISVKAEMEKRLVNQKRVGLTGVIGSGKSTIMRKLVESANVTHIDLDAIAQDILFHREEEAYQNLRLEIQINLNMSAWTRKELGNIIFNNAESRELFNKCLREPLYNRIRAKLVNAQKYVVFDSALLVEANMLDLCNNEVIVLDVNPGDQRYRLYERGHIGDQIDKRISAQFSTAAKIEAIKKKIEKDNYGTITQINTSIWSIDQCVDAVKQKLFWS